uniref:uncharacterized protein n=1 Tax=Myxine glutinosa TaxID=7769 RepID=UPI00358DF547
MEADWALLCLLTALRAVLCLADGKELHGCGDGSVDPWHDPRGSITYLEYKNNAYCQCSIEALPSESVHLHLSYLDVEPSPHCKFDRLMLKLAGQSVRYLCGPGVAGGTHVEARGHVLIIFQSDESKQYGGFVLHYEVTLDWCRRLKPCQHGARCENLQRTFHCHCKPGWAGPSCQHGLADVAAGSLPRVHGAFPPAKDQESSPSTSVHNPGLSVTISSPLPVVGATNTIDPELEVVHSSKKEKRPEFNLAGMKNQLDTIVYNPKVQDIVKEIDQDSKLVLTVQRLPSTHNDVTYSPEPTYSIKLDAEQSSGASFAFRFDHGDVHSGLSALKPNKGTAATSEVDFTTPICKESSCPLNSTDKETLLSSTIYVVENRTNEIHPRLSVVQERLFEKDVDNRTFKEVSSTLWDMSSSINSDQEHSDTVTPSITASQLTEALRGATAQAPLWSKTANDEVDVQHLKQKASIVEDNFSQEHFTQSSGIQKEPQLVNTETPGTIEAFGILKPNMKRRSQMLSDGISSHISGSATNNNHGILKTKIKEVDYDWMSKSTSSLGIGLQAKKKATISEEMQKPLKSDEASQPTSVKRFSDITMLQMFTSPLKGLLSKTETLKSAPHYRFSMVSTPKTSTKINSAISAEFEKDPSHRQIESSASTSVSRTLSDVTDSAHTLRFDFSSSQPTRPNSSAVLDAELILQQRVTEPYSALSRETRKLPTNSPNEFDNNGRNGFTQNTLLVPDGQQHQETVEYPKFPKPPPVRIPTSFSYRGENKGTSNAVGHSSENIDTSIPKRWSSSNLWKLPTSVSTSRSLLTRGHTSETMKSTSFIVTKFLGIRDDRVSVLDTSRGTKRYLPSDSVTAKVSSRYGVLEISDRFSKDDLTPQQTSDDMWSTTVSTPFALYLKNPRLHFHPMTDTSWTKNNYSYLGSTRPISWPKSLGDLQHHGHKERLRFSHNMATRREPSHGGHQESVTSPSVAVQLASLTSVRPFPQIADLSNTVPSKGFKSIYVPQKSNGLFGTVKLDLTTMIPEFETSSAVTWSRSRIFPGTTSIDNPSKYPVVTFAVRPLDEAQTIQSLKKFISVRPLRAETTHKSMRWESRSTETAMVKRLHRSFTSGPTSGIVTTGPILSPPRTSGTLDLDQTRARPSNPDMFIASDRPAMFKGIARVQVAFRLNLQKSFQKVLGHVGSPEHDSLALACRELIEPFFWNVSGFQEVIVKGIRPGSVIVDCEAVFSAGPVQNLLHDMPKLLWKSGLPRAVSAGLTIAGSRVTNLILTGTRPVLCGSVFTCEPGFKCLQQLGKPVCRSLCHLGLCQHEGVCSHPSGELPSCRCPVGEDFWFVGSQCNERRTKQSVSLTGVVLGAILAVIAMATVTVTTLLLRARQRRNRRSSRAGDADCAESSYRRFSRCDEISAPSRHSSWLSALSSDSQCGSDVTVGAPGDHTNAPSALRDIWVPLTDPGNGRCSCRLDTSQDLEGNLLGSNPVSRLVSARGCPTASNPQYSPICSQPLDKVKRSTVQAFQEDLQMAELRISTWKEHHLREAAYDHRNEGHYILKAFDDGDSLNGEVPKDGRFTGRLTTMRV